MVIRDRDELGRFPLHNLEAILCFSYKGASPALMGACAERGVALSFFTPRGRFLAQSSGELRGNVPLRKQQYRVSDDETQSCLAARSFILGKLANSSQSIKRTLRDHALRVDTEKLSHAVETIRTMLEPVAQCEDLEQLRGLEGYAATVYFEVFDAMILQNKDAFYFHGRSRRPPLDMVNALLSFSYTLLARDCTASLESVGLDPYVGFLHRDRPGRPSLALDLMEELRPVYADRFVLALINNRIMRDQHFERKENGAVYFTQEGRKQLLSAWQNRKKETIVHPFLREKIAWGLLPYVQAQLLTRYLRGDMDAYPPFFWR